MGCRERHGSGGRRNSPSAGASESGTISLRKSSFLLGADASVRNSAGTANWASPEDVMHKAWTAAALALMLSLVDAPAQIAPQQPGDVLAPTPKLNLTLEQRHTIRELVK